MANEVKEPANNGSSNSNSPSPNTNPYVYIADLKAHIRERDIIVERIAANSGPTASDLEELKAHQELINRRRAALAEMPVPYGVMSISTNTETWSFVGGEWVKYEEIHKISDSPKNQLQCGGATLWWDDNGGLDDDMVDDSYINIGDRYVINMFVIQDRVFCAESKGIIEYDYTNKTWESTFEGLGGTFVEAAAVQ